MLTSFLLLSRNTNLHQTLAKYVMALVQADMPRPQLQAHCRESLNDILDEQTNDFVSQLFAALDKESYRSGQSGSSTRKSKGEEDCNGGSDDENYSGAIEGIEGLEDIIVEDENTERGECGSDNGGSGSRRRRRRSDSSDDESDDEGGGRRRDDDDEGGARGSARRRRGSGDESSFRSSDNGGRSGGGGSGNWGGSGRLPPNHRSQGVMPMGSGMHPPHHQPPPWSSSGGGGGKGGYAYDGGKGGGKGYSSASMSPPSRHMPHGQPPLPPNGLNRGPAPPPPSLLPPSHGNYPPTGPPPPPGMGHLHLPPGPPPRPPPLPMSSSALSTPSAVPPASAPGHTSATKTSSWGRASTAPRPPPQQPPAAPAPPPPPHASAQFTPPPGMGYNGGMAATAGIGIASGDGGIDGRKGVCFAFQKAGVCARGDTCRFSHEASSTSSSVHASAANGQQVCYTFQNTGACSRGAACKYFHDLTASSSAAVPGATGASTGASTGAGGGSSEQQRGHGLTAPSGDGGNGGGVIATVRAIYPVTKCAVAWHKTRTLLFLL